MIDHTGSDGSTAADRIKRVGYVRKRTGENSAEGQWDVGEVMTGWMKSPGHRANILANFTEMGAARARDDQGTIYWCVDFGTPMLASPRPPRKPEDLAARGHQADQPRPPGGPDGVAPARPGADARGHGTRAPPWPPTIASTSTATRSIASTN